jgi:hypothetical protein
MFNSSVLLLTAAMLLFYSYMLSYPKKEGFLTLFFLTFKLFTQLLGVYWFFVALKQSGVI